MRNFSKRLNITLISALPVVLVSVFCLFHPGVALAFGFNGSAFFNLFGSYRFLTPSRRAPARQWVVRIEAVTSTGAFQCSGVLIAPRKVLTAAHCVLERDSSQPAETNPSLLPQAFTVFGHHSTQSAVLAVYPLSQMGVADSSRDLAILTLEGSLGDPAVFPSLSNLRPDPDRFEGPWVNLYGYSLDFERGLRLTYDRTCRLYSVFDHTFDTDCSFSAGASGGPVFIPRRAGHELVGIISSQLGQIPAGKNTIRVPGGWAAEVSNKVTPVSLHLNWILTTGASPSAR